MEAARRPGKKPEIIAANTTNDDMRTVQSGLRALKEGALQSPNLVMAGTVIAAIPIVIALLVFQKALVRGLTAGAVKG